MFDFDKHLADLAGQTVLCIGDLMLDEFVYGEVSRISPEAPTPVIAVKRSEVMIGGAGNVARNLVALGIALRLRRRGRQRRRRQHAERGLGRPSAHRIPPGGRCGAADHAQGALRLRAPLHPHAARRLGNGFAGRQDHRGRADRPCRQGDAARQRRRAVRLCQGRAHAARHPRRDRRRQRGGQAGRGRSEGPRLRHLSRRHHDHAEPAGACRRHREPGADRR